MAATKYAFLTQPINTTQGYTLQGGAATDFSMLGVVLPEKSSSMQASPGIQVACLNADGTLDPTSTSSVTIAFGANPGSGVLSGTLVRSAVAGIATFNDLSVTATNTTNLGLTGYTLQASGALTTATSNPFNFLPILRQNPTWLQGNLISTGVGVAAATVGPYRFRGGASVKGVVVSATSTQAADAVQIYVTEPGSVTTATGLTALNAEKLILASGSAMGVTVTPFSMTLDSDELGGSKDIWVVGTTVTGSVTVNIQRVENQGRP